MHKIKVTIDKWKDLFDKWLGFDGAQPAIGKENDL